MAELTPALALHGVTKQFGGLTVADNVSFDVPSGARMALIGPNGAGKTTLFNLISGVFQLDAGSILLDGAPIEDLPPRSRVRAGLSRSFQNIRLMPHLSVIENVMLGQHTLARGVGGDCLARSPGSGTAAGGDWPTTACATPASMSIRMPTCRPGLRHRARKSRSCAR